MEGNAHSSCLIIFILSVLIITIMCNLHSRQPLFPLYISLTKLTWKREADNIFFSLSIFQSYFVKLISVCMCMSVCVCVCGRDLWNGAIFFVCVQETLEQVCGQPNSLIESSNLLLIALHPQTSEIQTSHKRC